MRPPRILKIDIWENCSNLSLSVIPNGGLLPWIAEIYSPVVFPSGRSHWHLEEFWHHASIYLEDHPMTCKWLTTMVIVSPLRIGLWDPFQMAFLWLLNWGDPNHLLSGMILQVGQRFVNFVKAAAPQAWFLREFCPTFAVRRSIEAKKSLGNL